MIKTISHVSLMTALKLTTESVVESSISLYELSFGKR